jgi:hypothetical protein
VKKIKSKDKISENRSISQYSKIYNTPSPATSNLDDNDAIIFRKFLSECGCPNVLIVDDQIINRLILKEFGSKYCINSDEAENGKIAYQMYQESLKRK